MRYTFFAFILSSIFTVFGLADDENRPKDWRQFEKLISADLNYRYSKFGPKNAMDFLNQVTDGMDAFYADKKNAGRSYPFEISCYKRTFYYPGGKACTLTEIAPEIWHEAQFKSGSGNPEWALELFTWIRDRAIKLKQPDWQWHVNASRLSYLNTLERYEELDKEIQNTRDFSAAHGVPLDPTKFPDKGAWNNLFPDVKLRDYPLVIQKPVHIVYWKRWESNRKIVPIVLDCGTLNNILFLSERSLRKGNWKECLEMILWAEAWLKEVYRRQEAEKPNLRTKRDELETIHSQCASLKASCLAFLNYPDLAMQESDRLLATCKPKNDFQAYQVLRNKIDATNDKLRLKTKPLITESDIASLEKQVKPSPYADDWLTTQMDLLRLSFYDSNGKLKEAAELLTRLEKRYKLRDENPLDVPQIVEYKIHHQLDSELVTSLEKRCKSIDPINSFSAYIYYSSRLVQCHVRRKNWQKASDIIKEMLPLLEKKEMEACCVRERVRLYAVNTLAGFPNKKSKTDLMQEVKTSGGEERQKATLLELLNDPKILAKAP